MDKILLHIFERTSLKKRLMYFPLILFSLLHKAEYFLQGTELRWLAQCIVRIVVEHSKYSILEKAKNGYFNAGVPP